jgi:hypothetical protein
MEIARSRATDAVFISGVCRANLPPPQRPTEKSYVRDGGKDVFVHASALQRAASWRSTRGSAS